ncbi:hypothetical protein AB0J80_14480 [Actinoplanes sp. NPDC049548]|uniref:hypothetical protein n=1 Tax=Actinoplanes sp. NPDC049548 TaxID=3155152 RepID=UPI003414C10F
MSSSNSGGGSGSQQPSQQQRPRIAPGERAMQQVADAFANMHVNGGGGRMYGVSMTYEQGQLTRLAAHSNRPAAAHDAFTQRVNSEVARAAYQPTAPARPRPPAPAGRGAGGSQFVEQLSPVQSRAGSLHTGNTSSSSSTHSRGRGGGGR